MLAYSSASNLNKKDLVDAYFMRGQCLNELFRYKEALVSFDRVIEVKADFALVGLRNVLEKKLS